MPKQFSASLTLLTTHTCCWTDSTNCMARLISELWDLGLPGKCGHAQLWPFLGRKLWSELIKNKRFLASSFEVNWKPAAYSGEPLHLSSPWTLTARSAKCRSLYSYDKIYQKIHKKNTGSKCAAAVSGVVQSSIESDEPRSIDQLPGFRPFEKTLANKTRICDSLCMSCFALACSLGKIRVLWFSFPVFSSAPINSWYVTVLGICARSSPKSNELKVQKEIQRNELWNFWDCKWIFPAFLVQFYCRSEEQSLELLGATRIVGNKPQAVSKRLWRTYALINAL